ncbi:MAG: SDR family NAD(P)-dependent oxidoreductase [Spirochaetes bacterium]|nr:MAG: SDR family NAD(P)-dependent oxidoreductase [Spirochaetota bacterium]
MRKKFDYNDKIVLLTGATGGLGSSLARMLAQAGARLVFSARSRTALEELRAALANPERAEIVMADLSVTGEGPRLAREAESIYGRIDVVVNNAGLGYFATMDEADEERLRYLFEVNMFAPLAIARALIPGMKARGSGRIVNVVSFAGRVPIVTNGSYGGSKSALAIMMNTMRLELAGTGVDVINIYPGTAATAFEENALREPGRDRICPRETCGDPRDEVAREVFEASKGMPGEKWLDRSGRAMAVLSLLWPRRVERRLEPLRKRVLDGEGGGGTFRARRWRLWQVETSIACNLSCIMCPWDQVRAAAGSEGLMKEEVWAALRPHLGDVASIDFSGGGEALMNPHLPSWIAEAHGAGCVTGFLSNGSLLTAERARGIVDAGVDWIALSIDGATGAVYDSIRKGARFDRLIENMEALASLKKRGRPRLVIIFVMMNDNIHQLDDMVRLAARYSFDRITFKQCDVIRGESGRGFGLFGGTRNREVRRYEKMVSKARRLGKRLEVEVSGFSFVPEEQPVCAQDPRSSVFVRYDGRVSPCINLAYGGATTWLGKEVVMPSVHYGALPADELDSLWETPSCILYRTRFEERYESFNRRIAGYDREPSLQYLRQIMEEARKGMPEPLEGCKVCPYLYGI